LILVAALSASALGQVAEDAPEGAVVDSAGEPTTEEADASAMDEAEAPEADETEPPAADENPRVGIAVSVQAEEGKQTPLGTIVIELYPQKAPQHVENFLKLVKDKFYVGTTFHRIVPAFVIQGGDKVSKRNWKSSRVGTGSDGPDYTIPAEIGLKHVRGAVAAARTQNAVNPNRESSPSQFYICLADLPALDRIGYSVFGQVVQGMDVVDKIARVQNSGQPRNQALKRVHMTDVYAIE
jgi:cyclophilin family peptidyl-prolyl cis-trans isomerase